MRRRYDANKDRPLWKYGGLLGCVTEAATARRKPNAELRRNMCPLAGCGHLHEGHAPAVRGGVR